MPQISPFLFVDLGFQNPGLIFLFGQIGACLGSLFAGYRSDKSLNVRTLQMVSSVPLILTSFFIAHTPNMEIDSSHKFYLLLFLWSFGIFCLTANLSLASVSFLQNEEKSDHFGGVRLYGTLGFGVINIFLMFLDKAPKEIMSYAPFMFILSGTALFWMPLKRKLAKKDKTFEPEESVSIRSIYLLVKQPKFLFFWIILFLFFFHFSPAEYIVSVHVQDINIKFFSGRIRISPIPLAWGLATIVEMIFLFCSPFILKKIDITLFTFLSFIVGILRFGFMIFLPLDTLVVCWQMLHGIHFGSSFLGAILYIEKIAPPRKLATVLALIFHTARCLGIGFGAFYFSQFVEEKQFSELFLISTLFGVIGLVAYFFYWMAYIRKKGQESVKIPMILE